LEKLENEEKNNMKKFLRSAKRKGTDQAIKDHFEPDQESNFNKLDVLELFGMEN